MLNIYAKLGDSQPSYKLLVTAALASSRYKDFDQTRLMNSIEASWTRWSLISLFCVCCLLQYGQSTNEVTHYAFIAGPLQEHACAEPALGPNNVTYSTLTIDCYTWLLCKTFQHHGGPGSMQKWFIKDNWTSQTKLAHFPKGKLPCASRSIKKLRHCDSFIVELMCLHQGATICFR